MFSHVSPGKGRGRPNYNSTYAQYDKKKKKIMSGYYS